MRVDCDERLRLRRLRLTGRAIARELGADLATPVTPRDEDGYVALYIGIGQAF